ncbi:MAG: DUF973 family protein [Thermoplasmata archaeon]
MTTPAPIERESMNTFQIASIFGLCGCATSLGGYYALGHSLIPYASSVSVTTPGIPVAIAIALALFCVEVCLFRKSFRLLSSSDPALRTSARLSIYAAVGPALAIASFYVLVYGYPCALNANSLPAGCVYAGYFLSILTLLIGALLAIIGYVALFLGIWRVGTHYAERRLKIGMSLVIFPYLDVVGYIILISGSRRVRSRLGEMPPTRPS